VIETNINMIIIINGLNFEAIQCTFFYVSKNVYGAWEKLIIFSMKKGLYDFIENGLYDSSYLIYDWPSFVDFWFIFQFLMLD